jgi:DNA polymerase III delta subunit
MFYLFHGQNVVKSRQELGILVSEYPSSEVDFLKSDEIQLGNLSTLLSTQPMFSKKRLVVLEGKLSASLQKELSPIFEATPSSCDVAFWHEEFLPKSNKLLLFIQKHHGKIMEYKEYPKEEVFLFLDALASMKRKDTLEGLFRLIASGQDQVYILNMLIWNFRSMLMVKLNSNGASKLHPFVKKKMAQFNQNYSPEDLVEIYRKLLYYEIAVKSGHLPSTLFIDSLLSDIYARQTL